MPLPRPRRTALVLAVVALAACLCSTTVRAQEAHDEELKMLVESVATAEDAGYAWNDAVKLSAYRAKATPLVLDAVASEATTPLGRVALARVLADLGERDRATQALLDVATSDAPVALRTEAVRMLVGIADDTCEDRLWQLVDDTLDPRLKATTAQTLWLLTKDLKAKALMRELLRSDSFDLQVAGALAMAEVGDTGTDVSGVLQRIRREPTERGRLAEALLAKAEWMRIHTAVEEVPAPTPPAEATQPNHDGGPSDPLEAIVYEVLSRVRQNYVDPEKLADTKLWEGAARGLVAAIGDPHTSFQSAEEREDWTDNLTKEYGGIGAYVGYDKENFFVVTRPMFGSPAWKNQLKSGDRVISVDGWQTIGQELDEIVKHLRGPAGTDVTIEVVRRGWTEPRKITLRRAQIHVPTVYAAMLPGSVGYVLVDNFARDTAEEFQIAIEKLQKDGATALVLDLRWNSGGYLRTAQQMADYLLPPNRLVVETAGRPNVTRDEVYITRGSSTTWSRSVPMRVLVNGGSASASEILSGCLQVHGRARIVGLRTFGKGSVQNAFPIFARPFAEPYTDTNRNGTWDDDEPYNDSNGNGRWDPGEPLADYDRSGAWTAAEPYEDLNGNGHFDFPAVKITIAKYYVGNKVGAHQINPHREEMIVAGRREWLGGIEPDVPVDSDELDGWRAEAIAKLEEKGVFDDYLKPLFASQRDTMIGIAQGPADDPTVYPGFEAFYASLGTQLSTGDVAYWLHARTRALASDEVGRLLVGDWAVDAQLQRALADLADHDASFTLPEVLAFSRTRTYDVPPTYDPAALAAARPVRAADGR